MAEPAVPPERPPGARRSGPFGRLALGFLPLVVASGALLTPFWSARAPLESLEAIAGGVPFGWFVRALHAFSALGLLLASLAHGVEVVALRTEGRLRPSLWWWAILSLPVLGMAMLSGFVLQGGPEARSAGDVWHGILTGIPGLGEPLATLLLGADPADATALALHHAGTLTLGLTLLTALHGRRLLPDNRSAVLATIATAVVAALATPSMPPATADAGPHLGPWYLLGLQGALGVLPSAVGWAGPLVLMLTLGAMRHAHGRTRTALLAALVTLLLAYVGFTVRVLGGS